MAAARLLNQVTNRKNIISHLMVINVDKTFSVNITWTSTAVTHPGNDSDKTAQSRYCAVYIRVNTPTCCQSCRLQNHSHWVKTNTILIVGGLMTNNGKDGKTPKVRTELRIFSLSNRCQCINVEFWGQVKAIFIAKRIGPTSNFKGTHLSQCYICNTALQGIYTPIS